MKHPHLLTHCLKLMEFSRTLQSQFTVGSKLGFKNFKEADTPYPFAYKTPRSSFFVFAFHFLDFFLVSVRRWG